MTAILLTLVITTDPGGPIIPVVHEPLLVEEGPTQLSYAANTSSASIYNYCVRGVVSTSNTAPQEWQVLIDTNKEPFKNLPSASYLSLGNANYSIEGGSSATPDSQGFMYIKWSGSNAQQYQHVTTSNPVTVDVCINNAAALFPVAVLTPTVGPVNGGGWYAT